MTTKLTLTLDDAVILNAKKYAKSKGKSLSKLVENYFQSLTNKNTYNNTISPEILKIKGCIVLPKDFNYKTDLAKSISKKHKT